MQLGTESFNLSWLSLPSCHSTLTNLLTSILTGHKLWVFNLTLYKPLLSILYIITTEQASRNTYQRSLGWLCMSLNCADSKLWMRTVVYVSLVNFFRTCEELVIIQMLHHGLSAAQESPSHHIYVILMQVIIEYNTYHCILLSSLRYHFTLACIFMPLVFITRSLCMNITEISS